MSVLYAIASIRNPVFDVFFSLVTRFGEEVIYLAVALFFIWCVDKFEGYYILSVGFLGVIVNQFLKIVCRVPRPWVKDPSFSVVEGTKEAATGYSFPSGHTQTAVGTFGGIAYWHRKRSLSYRVLSFASWLPSRACISVCIALPTCHLVF
ncbi:MAG: phosphatase PAP2 family protein [Clostridia bacterium]|nr:phosphatase PAP2 family protein [Clostridia bacterium]